LLAELELLIATFFYSIFEIMAMSRIIASNLKFGARANVGKLAGRPSAFTIKAFSTDKNSGFNFYTSFYYFI
jgi:hypothetical protein